MIESSNNFIKIQVDDLALGMYVSGLDRPWIDTPFLFQGFRLESADQITELQKYCRFVFVDKEKSIIHNIRRNFISGAASSSSVQTSVPHCVLPTDPDFKHHMKYALRLHSGAKNFIEKIMNDAQRGKDPDVKEAKVLVSSLVKNIIANPMALIWLTQLKNRDEYTSIHSLNVCILALFFGRSLGMNTQQLNELGLGALLHDIGKLRVPLEILNKPAKLTDEEYDVIKQHTTLGYDLLKNKDELSRDSLAVIKNHHERIDGHGYPYGLQSYGIDLYSRIVKIIDVYDAVTSRRVYQRDLTPYHALNCIYSDRNGAFDEKLVQEFLKHMGIYPVGCVIELNTGEVGVVTSINEKRHLSPTLLLMLNGNKQPLKQHKYINLAAECWPDEAKRPRIERVIDPDDYKLDIARLFSTEAISLAYHEIKTPDQE
ncbi:MAG: HD-GYP domain-containing protein [Gammaproteobacteria bacterium]|nr:HD-GYP domain-containing protein [Gammaproteobacteria bacterium]